MDSNGVTWTQGKIPPSPQQPMPWSSKSVPKLHCIVVFAILTLDVSVTRGNIQTCIVPGFSGTLWQ